MKSKEPIKCHAFLYEIDSELASNLKNFFQNVPNVKFLQLEGFPDDEIVGEIVSTFCQKLISLTLNLNFLNCVDKQRLTDEGICDFIEDSNQNLEHLDLSQLSIPNISAKSVITLHKLKCLRKVELRDVHLQYFDLYYKSDFVIKSVKVLSIYCGLRDEKIQDLIFIIDQLFIELKYLAFHQISYQNPKNYSQLKLQHLNRTLQSFSIEETVCLDQLFSTFPNLIEVSCLRCNSYGDDTYPPEIKKSETKIWPLNKFKISYTNITSLSPLVSILKNMPSLKHFYLVSNTINIDDIRLHLPKNCEIEILKGDANKICRDSFIEF